MVLSVNFNIGLIDVRKFTDFFLRCLNTAFIKKSIEAK